MDSDLDSDMDSDFGSDSDGSIDSLDSISDTESISDTDSLESLDSISDTESLDSISDTESLESLDSDCSLDEEEFEPLWKGFSYFQHQEVGIRWMLDKERRGTMVPNRDYTMSVPIYGGFQCDEMGLGKTIQIVGTILNNPLQNTLLIVPLAMIDTWTQICKKCDFQVFHMGPMGWTRARSQQSQINVYITNYHKLISRKLLFRKNLINRLWDRVVLDEAHMIRNGKGIMSKCAREIRARVRWVVSGTPLVNGTKDLVSLLAFLGVPYAENWAWEPRYNDVLPQMLIHRSMDMLRKDATIDVPPIPQVSDIVLPFETVEEEEFYNGVQVSNERLISRFNVLPPQQKLILLLRLRQISVHPQVYIEAINKDKNKTNCKVSDWAGSSTKLMAIERLIKEEKEEEENHKYLIFCSFHEEMMLIRRSLTCVKPSNILMYHGGMSQTERSSTLARSKRMKGTTVMLIQIQAGGVGLNLQEYDRVLFVSPYWTAALMDQALARAVRMGQKEVVKVYHLKLAVENNDLCLNIDQLVSGKAEIKRDLLLKVFDMCEPE